MSEPLEDADKPAGLVGVAMQASDETVDAAPSTAVNGAPEQA